MDVRIIDIRDRAEAHRHIAEIGVDARAITAMAQKAVLWTVKLCRIENRAANLIKQEALSVGADAATNHEVSRFARGVTDVLLMATDRQLDTLIQKLLIQPFGLSAVAQRIARALSNYSQTEFVLRYGRKNLRLGTTPAVMGILNVTPDSFSDGGLYSTQEKAVDRGLNIAHEGAHFIDIGGESTRPGSRGVSIAEEKKRVLPVIKKLARHLRIPISIDTSEPEVAEAALECGATMINDVSALRTAHGSMTRIAARFRVPVVLMHMRGLPRTMQKKPVYRDVIAEISDFLSERIEFALQRGVKPDQIIIDPGIGFGKTVEHNLEILRRLREFKVLGYPMAIGTSRKRFIGTISHVDEPRDRLAGSITTAVWAVEHGAQMVRVHDVKETIQAMKLLTELT